MSDNSMHVATSQINTKLKDITLLTPKDIIKMSEVLLAECQKLKLSPLDIEERSGVSYRTIAYWRKGRNPKLMTVMDFAETLDYEIIVRKKKS